MLFKDGIECRSNVFITARERGKKVPGLCRDGHNQWVNGGRLFAARAVTPQAAWAHLSTDVVKFMGFGIGGELQTATIPTTPGSLGYDYPGQVSFTDDDIAVSTLERPIKVSGTPGRGSASGTWLQTIVLDNTTPAFLGDPASTVEYMCLFNDAGELDLGGTYTNIPLSEIGLYTSAAAATLASDVVYDYNSSPAYIGASRQLLIAYHTFSPITKTPSISLEVRWQLQF